MPALELTGRVVGRLTVLSMDRKGKGGAWWACVCSCGARPVVRASALNRGTTKSCGCLNRETRKLAPRTHGATVAGARPHEYWIWLSMKQRCDNPRTKQYKYYGGRGIKVCERWRDYSTFIADIGPRPSRAHSLDRYPNPDGHYEPGNVRWATMLEQRHNRSRAAHV